jgi:cell shape-determining protein MreD
VQAGRFFLGAIVLRIHSAFTQRLSVGLAVLHVVAYGLGLPALLGPHPDTPVECQASCGTNPSLNT